MGVTIRHWFNTQHARKGNPHWTWARDGAAVPGHRLAVDRADADGAGGRGQAAGRGAGLCLAPTGFEDVVGIVQGRCSMCHAAEPGWEGMHWPPKGVVLETEAQIAHEARRIYLQAGVSHAMPPGNLSYMEPEERAAIVRLVPRAGRRTRSEPARLFEDLQILEGFGSALGPAVAFAVPVVAPHARRTLAASPRGELSKAHRSGGTGRGASNAPRLMPISSPICAKTGEPQVGQNDCGRG